MEVARSKKGLVLYQRKHTLDLDLLQDCGLLGAKPTSTSMDYTLKLSKESGEPLSDVSNYRRVIGRLLYLTNTGPDIAFAVGKLSQYLDCPSTTHQQAVHRVLRYLKGSPAAHLFFSSSLDLVLTGFVNSDWGFVC